MVIATVWLAQSLALRHGGAMRTLYLHVGKHKTGTTSLQRYINDEPGFFQAQGITIFRNRLFAPEDSPLKKRTCHCFHLAHAVIRTELRTKRRIEGETYVSPIDQRSARRFNRRLHARAGERSLVTSEAFSFLRTSAERELLDVIFEGFDVRPVLTLRNKTEWMRSWKANIQTTIAAHGLPDDVTGTIFDLSPSSWMLDDDAIQDFFGKKAIALPYEEIMTTEGSAIPAFLRAIDVNPGAAPAWDGFWRNVTALKAQTWPGAT